MSEQRIDQGDLHELTVQLVTEGLCIRGSESVVAPPKVREVVKDPHSSDAGCYISRAGHHEQTYELGLHDWRQHLEIGDLRPR